MNFFDLFFAILILLPLPQAYRRGLAAELPLSLGLITLWMVVEKSRPQIEALVRPFSPALVASPQLLYLGVMVSGSLLLGAMGRVLLPQLKPGQNNLTSKSMALVLASSKGMVACLVVAHLVEAGFPSFVDDLQASGVTSWLLQIRSMLIGSSLAWMH